MQGRQSEVEMQQAQPEAQQALPAAASEAAKDDETAQLPMVFCNPLFGAVTPGPSDSRATKV